jgi:hypothetical protein
MQISLVLSILEPMPKGGTFCMKLKKRQKRLKRKIHTNNNGLAYIHNLAIISTAHLKGLLHEIFRVIFWLE